MPSTGYAGKPTATRYLSRNSLNNNKLQQQSNQRNAYTSYSKQIDSTNSGYQTIDHGSFYHNNRNGNYIILLSYHY